MIGYQVWNGKDDIYTPSGKMYNADEWKEMYPWVRLPGVKMIITKPPINGGVALEFTSTVDTYKSMGANITDDMTDQEICDMIGKYETEPHETTPSAEERIAASLEAQTLLNSMSLINEDSETTPSIVSSKKLNALSNTNSVQTFSLDYSTQTESKKSAAYDRVMLNYKNGLWPEVLVNLAARAGQITPEEAEHIIGGLI